MIPKIIHYCWFGRGKKSKLFDKCYNSWQKYCPDWKILEWNEDNLDLSSMPLYVQQAYENKKWGFVPDYIRLWLIYTYGGVYLDTDVELIKPLDSLCAYSAFAGFETPRFVALGLGFGAEPGNILIKRLMNSYYNLSFINPDGTLNTLPSPTLNMPIFEEIGVRRDGSFQQVEHMTFLPVDYLCPMNWETRKIRKTPNTVSIHWYDASWWSKKQRRLYFWGRVRNGILWLPKKVLYWVLGEEKYEKFKSEIKR